MCTYLKGDEHELNVAARPAGRRSLSLPRMTLVTTVLFELCGMSTQHTHLGYFFYFRRFSSLTHYHKSFFQYSNIEAAEKVEPSLPFLS